MKFAQAMLQLSYTSLMILFTGYTYSCLWNWFVVSTFQAPVISVPVAIGLAMFIVMFRETDFKKAEVEDFQTKSNVVIFLKPAFVLLVAYVAKQFM